VSSFLLLLGARCRGVRILNSRQRKTLLAHILTIYPKQKHRLRRSTPQSIPLQFASQQDHSGVVFKQDVMSVQICRCSSIVGVTLAQNSSTVWTSNLVARDSKIFGGNSSHTKTISPADSRLHNSISGVP
jgi:hypothetical protein